ncbi:DUF3870 domain-containing protein [Priestia megaterium]|nr:DUF3870 domain-containing protein [Priestia megaterium]
MFSKDTIYVIGDAKAPQSNPITKQFNQYFVALVVNKTNGKIIDAECSATVDLTVRFIKSIFVGRHINDPDIMTDILERYFGASQKALMVAFGDAQKKYNQLV